MTYSAVPLIPRAVLLGNPEKTSPQISPDGTRLAYLAPVEGVLNVWIGAVGEEAHAVTEDGKRGIRMFLWQQDSRHILYLQDKDGDENWHIYQTDIETRATRDLTPYPCVHAQVLASEPAFPDQILFALNLRDPHLHDVYRVNLTTGEVTLDTENPGDVMGWTADNALQVRAAQAVLPDGGTEIRLRDTQDGSWRPFQSWGADETFGGVIGFTPDNRSVWLISSVGANAARLLEVEVATGQTKVVAEDPQYDVSEVLLHPRTHALQAVAFLRARLEWTLLAPELESDFAALREVGNGDLYIATRNLDDTVWIVALSGDDGPIVYFAYHRPEQKATRLFSARPALEHYTLAKMQPISYTARDGMTLYGYLTLPVGVEPKNLPLVLLVHGGPWYRDSWGCDSSSQHLANRGYAVLQINFRGSVGYGKAYLNAGDREWAGKMHDDLIDGKRWAVAQGVTTPDRVAIMGGSYGGFATLVGLTFTPEEFVCGVDMVGPSNLITLLKSLPPYWATMIAIMTRRLGSVEADAEFLKARSPLFFADRIIAPLLIAQGANDPRVTQIESDQIVEAMRKNGKPVDYLLFPDEGHGFARPENRLKFYAAAEDFLARYLGGRNEPPAPEERWDAFLK